MIFTIGELPPEYEGVVTSIGVLRQQLRYATSDHRRRWVGYLRRSTLARAVQGSNSIEGYNVTEEDAVAAVDEEEPFDAETETWVAVNGYRAAMGYVLQLSDDPYYRHNEGTLRSLHYMMVGFDLKSHPGRWRPGSVWVRNEASGQTVYEGPDVQYVPALMNELIVSLNAESRLPVMVRAALAHLNLVMIHPFSDGNGRMGRALQTMVLAREGIVDPRFSSIEEYLGRNTLEYYDVLARVGQGSWHPEHDALPWVKFCLTAHYRQAVTLLRRNKEFERLWSALEEELKSLNLNERMTLALADAAVGFRVRNSSYRKNADISDQVAGKDLRTLVDYGLLVPKGDRKWRSYVASDRLLQLRAKTRDREKLRTDPFALGLDRSGQPAQSSLPGLANGG
jgi:Fic family protein